MEQPEVTEHRQQRGYREDEITMTMRAYAVGVTVDTLVADAEKLRGFMNSTALPQRPDWADVAQFADITAERDRARATAVRLEQELAEKERELDETRQHLIKGVLLEVQRLGRDRVDLSGVGIAEIAAEKFGVEL